MTDEVLVRNSWLVEQADKKNIEEEAEKYDISSSEMARKLLYLGWTKWCALDQDGKNMIMGDGTLGEAEEAGGE